MGDQMGTNLGRSHIVLGPLLGKVYTNRSDLVDGSSLNMRAAIYFPAGEGASPATGPWVCLDTWGEFYPDIVTRLRLTYLQQYRLIRADP